MFPTCVLDALEPEVALAAARVLGRMGFEVGVSDDATCCGQPGWNAGHTEAAAKVARGTLQALAASSPRPIVVPAGSCATMVKIFWGELFHLHGTDRERRQVSEVAARTYEFAEFVAARGGPSMIRADPTPTVYHRSCHMLRELGIRDQPESLLDGTGADRRFTSAEDRCCGFGGLFSVKLPEVSVAMADDVLDAMEATQAARVVGCDATCLIQLRSRAARRGSALEFRHLAQVLDEVSGNR